MGNQIEVDMAGDYEFNAMWNFEDKKFSFRVVNANAQHPALAITCHPNEMGQCMPFAYTVQHGWLPDGNFFMMFTSIMFDKTTEWAQRKTNGRHVPSDGIWEKVFLHFEGPCPKDKFIGYFQRQFEGMIPISSGGLLKLDDHVSREPVMVVSHAPVQQEVVPEAALTQKIEPHAEGPLPPIP